MGILISGVPHSGTAPIFAFFQACGYFCVCSSRPPKKTEKRVWANSAVTNGEYGWSVLTRFFNFKLARFATKHIKG